MGTKATTNVIDYVLISIGTLFGLTDIESVLGIVILIIQFIRIIVKIIYAIKNKNKDELKNAIDEGTEFIENLKDKKDNGKDKE